MAHFGGGEQKLWTCLYAAKKCPEFQPWVCGRGWESGKRGEGEVRGILLGVRQPF